MSAFIQRDTFAFAFDCDFLVRFENEEPEMGHPTCAMRKMERQFVISALTDFIFVGIWTLGSMGMDFTGRCG